MAVVEHEPYGVLTHRLDLADPHRLFAEHQRLLAGTMAFDLRRGRLHAQELEGEGVLLVRAEGDLQHPRLAAQTQFGGDGHFQTVVPGWCVHGRILTVGQPLHTVTFGRGSPILG